MSPSHLLVLAKEPSPGRAKTRLAAGLGRERTVTLARAFLEDTLDLAAEATRSLGVEATVVFSPAEARPFFAERATPRGLSVAAQVDGDLGRRLSAAFAEALGGGPRPVVAIGTDAPDLPLERLAAAFERLGEAPVVLGPSPDGGYHLIGLARAEAAALLEGPIRWSTDHALADTRAALAGAGLVAELLEPHADVDDLAALAALEARLRSGATTAPATARALGLAW